MNKFVCLALLIWPAAIACAQGLAPESTPAPAALPSPTAAARDVEALRQQVQSLTETVKALQQQVQDQQAALEKANLTGAPAAGASPAATPSAPALFPTEDTSVVASAPRA